MNEVLLIINKIAIVASKQHLHHAGACGLFPLSINRLVQ